MKKNIPDIEKVRTLHQSGQFKQAEAGYLALLRKKPRDLEALHSLAMLYAQQENFADAIHYLQTAIRYYPAHSTLQLHLANILKAQGLYNQATEVLHKIIAENPHYAAALNNLGTIYYAQGKLPKAIDAYYQAVQAEPSYIDAYYNLGLALGKQQQWDDAVANYLKLLSLSPEHFAARFHLACIWMKQEKFDEALHELLKIETYQPNHFETQSNMATCYLKKGDLRAAKKHYIKALELTQNDTQILFNLGVIDTQQGNLDSAIQYYQKATHINPDFFAAHNNLGVAFLAKQHAAFALHHFQEAARLQPENKAIQYTIQALSQNQRLLSAPTDYIKSLFDAYADHYESHLVAALSYQIPEYFQRAIKNRHPLPAAWDILDLGCGTGLCGIPFKPFAKTLTGVDLSENMLAVAANKKIYDVLTCAELTAFLRTQNSAYDLILAGDVLVYIGDLTAIFQHIKQALRTQGIFIFNAEVSEQNDYTMNQSGRFSHQKKYLEELAKRNGLSISYYEKAITRMQNNEPVYGHIYVLQASL